MEQRQSALFYFAFLRVFFVTFVIFVVEPSSFMNVLVTAGNTIVPIDRVRCITNVFTGRTGAQIALHAESRGHAVTLLTSHPEGVETQPSSVRWTLERYSTFADLEKLLDRHVRVPPDVIIHCAAVSDYQCDGVYAPSPGTRFVADDCRWESNGGTQPSLAERAAGKIKSDEPELWLRLVRTPKLVDRFRREWTFRGILVKFKLEVGVEDERLLEIAEQSRRQSEADLMVANTLEGMHTWAYLGPIAGRYEKASRRELPARLLDAVEQLKVEATHG
jgi:phosphopantothenoylcysteine synthetase/decarboxylase